MNELVLDFEPKKKNKIFAPIIEQKYDFNDAFFRLCRTAKKRVRKDYDAVIVITGDEGSSKSTLANHLGFHTDNKFTFEKNVLFSPDEKSMVKAIRELPRFSAINADEAIKVLYKQEWWRQTFLNKFYRLCRQDNKISIFCLPRFNELNSGFRNHRVLVWIHIIDRGLGIIFQKDWNPFCTDPWRFDENEKMIRKYSRGKKMGDFSMDKKINILSRSPNFLEVVTYPDLDTKTRQTYKEMAAKYKYSGLEEELEFGMKNQTRSNKWKERTKKIVEILHKEKGMMQKDIAEKLSVDKKTVSRWLNEDS